MTMASARRLFILRNRPGDLGRNRIDPADEYRAEAGASREVLLDDSVSSAAAPTPRDGSTAMGIWLAPPL